MCSSNCRREDEEAKETYDKLSSEEKRLITDLRQIETNTRWANEDFTSNLTKNGYEYVKAYKQHINYQLDQILKSY